MNLPEKFDVNVVGAEEGGLLCDQSDLHFLATYDYEFAVEKEEVDAETGEKFAKIIFLKYAAQDFRLNCRITNKRVVEQGILPKVNEFEMKN